MFKARYYNLGLGLAKHAPLPDPKFAPLEKSSCGTRKVHALLLWADIFACHESTLYSPPFSLDSDA